MDTSIVIATHNEGPALGRTIESCVETVSGPGYEIVVADDASTDGSVDAAQQRFPLARIVRHGHRQGASAAKALGARHARGSVLIFLDAHTRPENGAIARLVRVVDELGEGAIVTPAIAALDAGRWQTDLDQVGHGYAMDLRTFDTRWVPLEEMRETQTSTGHMFESPSLIGCAFAIGRDLYEELWGFDPQMRSWGIEDLDLGLKCWQLGHRILHDPSAIVGHRFQSEFCAYEVPVEHVLVNKMRMARKNFTQAVWAQWMAACREENSGPLAGHPEGLWAHAWQLLQAGGPGLQQERSYLHARRTRDEFWYAERFGLTWPRLAGAGAEFATAAAGPSSSPSQQPSPSPRPAPTVEIQVNNTAAATDDLVLLRSQHPARRPAVSCQIRLTSNETSPVTIVLHDPAGLLLFPTAASVTVTLPVSKAFVAFQISGQTASAAIGDAVVEARVGTVTGPVAGRKPVTVVSFANTQLALTKGGNYSLTGSGYAVTGTPAVSFSAKATIQPAGVNCSAPQLKNIRIGLMQEVTAGAGFITRSWTNPTVVFGAGAPSGKAVVEHATITTSSSFTPAVTQPVNDGFAGAFPMYDTGQNSATALEPPAGCAGAATATSNDSPSSGFPATFSVPAVASDGTTVGNAVWQNRGHLTRVNHFQTFCVTFDTVSHEFSALRQATWDINLDSALANQHATVSADAAASTDPVAAPPQANNAPTATTTTQSGATHTFTSP